MKYIIALFLFITTLHASMLNNEVSKGMSTLEKKKRFVSLLLPIIDNVHKELEDQYNKTTKDIRNNTSLKEINTLKNEYNVKSNDELLMALKPHPKSIAMAQAAIESAWATSRFFNEANNVFGVWSKNKNEPRIPALKKRGTVTIWLKKFDTIKDSVKSYYKLLAKNPAYKEFRKLKMRTNDVYILAKKLNKYCELGDEYCIRLESIIRYNNFTKYD